MGPFTTISHGLVDWLARTSWQVGLVVAAVLVAQWLFDRRLSARWRYALWGLVVLRLAMPILPGSRASVFNLLPDERRPDPPAATATVSLSYVLVRDGVDFPQAMDAPAMPAPAAKMELDWRLILAGMWLVGAVTVALAMVRSHVRLIQRVARSARTADAGMLELLGQCKEQMGVRRAVELVISDAVGSPALMGMWRPRLLLPRDLTRTLGRDELRFIFLHELAHLKRWDLAVDCMLAALRAIHWFNPIVWLAMSRLRADRELARDTMVLAVIQSQEQQRYGQTILDLVEHFARPAAGVGAIGMVDGMGQLRRRMRLIARFTPGTRGGAILAIVLMVVVGCATLTEKKAAQSEDAQPPADANVLPTDSNTRLPAGSNRQVRSALAQTIPEVNFQDVTLRDALESLRKSSGADIHIDWKSIEAAGVSADTPVNTKLRQVTLRKALNLVLTEAAGGPKLTWYVEHGKIELTSLKTADAQRAIVVYALQDLLKLPPGQGSTTAPTTQVTIKTTEELMQLIKTTIQPDTWTDRGGKSSIRVFNNKVVVNAPRSVHEDIAGPIDEAPVRAGEKDRTAQALLDKKLPELTFESTPLSDAIDRLRDATGAPIWVNWVSLKQAGVERTAPVNERMRDVKVSTALKRILADAGGATVRLGYAVEDGVIVVSTTRDLNGNTETMVYDIRDLLASAPEDKRQQVADTVISLLKDVINRDTWAEKDGPGSVRYLSGQLIVAQTADNQRQVGLLLEKLREARTAQICVETRIISVPRGFMEKYRKEVGEKWDLLPKPKLFRVDAEPVPDDVVLDDEQMNRLLRSSQSLRESSIISAPRLTVFNGQQGTVRIGAERDDAGGRKAAVPGDGKGISLNLRPMMSADRKHVTVDLQLRMTEPDYTTATPAKDASPQTKPNAPPLVYVLDVKTLASIPDRGTLLLTGARYRSSDPAAPEPKRSDEVLLMVRPTIINPAPPPQSQSFPINRSSTAPTEE